jgi:di/tricarboxylate transporter
MKEKLAKLVDVKSIMTLMLTVIFCTLALRGVISGSEFHTIFTVVAGFYFGTQYQKHSNKSEQ